MKDIKKSENEVTVLGFNAAGWGTLEKVEKKRRAKISNQFFEKLRYKISVGLC